MQTDPTSDGSHAVRRLAGAVARHPGVWVEAARLAMATAPTGWWRHPPYVPLPDRAYLRWRTVTAYGGSGDLPDDLDDVVAFLRWRRRQRMLS